MARPGKLAQYSCLHVYARLCMLLCFSLNLCLHWSSTAYLYLCLYLDFYFLLLVFVLNIEY